MISLENEMITRVTERLEPLFPGIIVLSDDPYTVPSFPAVTLEEVDNVVWRRTLDSRIGENHALITFRANAYSNQTSGKRTQVKKIMAEIDDVFTSLGFRRLVNSPLKNVDDQTIARRIGLWDAVVDNNRVIFRR